MYEIESGIKAPRRRQPKPVPDNVRNAMGEYTKAYLKAFGVSPVLKYDKQTQYINTGSASVKLKRLKEMTRMLKWRVE